MKLCCHKFDRPCMVPVNLTVESQEFNCEVIGI